MEGRERGGPARRDKKRGGGEKTKQEGREKVPTLTKMLFLGPSRDWMEGRERERVVGPQMFLLNPFFSMDEERDREGEIERERKSPRESFTTYVSLSLLSGRRRRQRPDRFLATAPPTLRTSICITDTRREFGDM